MEISMDRFYFPIFLFSAVLAVGWIWYWGADPLWGEQYEALNQESSVESAKRRGALAYEQKDWATVVRILQKPALEGDMESQYLLGGLYWEGGRNLPKDPEIAAHWWLLAAEQGDADAMHGLSWVYRGGHSGVACDLTRAWLFLELSTVAEIDEKAQECLSGTSLRSTSEVESALLEARACTGRVGPIPRIPAEFYKELAENPECGTDTPPMP